MTVEATCDELRLADAVLARLNTYAAAGTFSRSFEATFALRPRFDVEDLAQLQVLVVPGDSEEKPASRGKVWSDCTVAVGITQVVTSQDDGRALLNLGQEIRDVLRQGFADLQAAWTGTARGPKFIGEQLDQHTVFNKAFQMTFRMPGGR